MPYIFDVFLLIIVLCFIFAGRRKGFVRMFLQLVRGVAAFAGAILTGNFLADWFFEKTVRGKLVQSFSDAGSREASALWESVPNVLRRISENSGLTQSGFEEGVQSASRSAAEGAAEIIRPAAVLLMALILTVVIFILIYALIGLLIRAVDKIFKLPLLDQVNHFMGGIAGAAAGVLAVLILCFFADSIAVLLPPSAAAFLGRSMELSQIKTFADGINPLL